MIASAAAPAHAPQQLVSREITPGSIRAVRAARLRAHEQTRFVPAAAQPCPLNQRCKREPLSSFPVIKPEPVSSAPVPNPVPPRAWVWGRPIAVGLALGYIAALVLVLAGLRFVGESWWLTTAALYLPRLLFALPLPFVVLALRLAAPRRLLWLVPVAVALLLFPLMGLHIGRGVLVKSARAAQPGLRIVSYNMSSADHAALVAQTIASAKADLVLLQEWDAREAPFLAGLDLAGYQTHFDGQFGVLSRFPISDVHLPPRVTIAGSESRPAEFIRYRIETGLGPITVFNVHPLSPRESLMKFGGATLLEPQLRRHKPGREDGTAALKRNALLRWRQAEAIVAQAAEISGPVIIAGDTNLPGLSRIYAQTLAGYTDGFAEVGRGFGYTFPASHPWMRIDRILASGHLAFERFDVLPGPGSDHLAIAAELSAP